MKIFQTFTFILIANFVYAQMYQVIIPVVTTGVAAVSQNGNDAIELFKNGVVIETFGDINVDGTGTAWEYADSWAYKDATGSVTFSGVIG